VHFTAVCCTQYHPIDALRFGYVLPLRNDVKGTLCIVVINEAKDAIPVLDNVGVHRAFLQPMS
jgi:hypothetical protein